MPPIRFTEAEYTQKQTKERWTRIAELRDDFVAFRNFVNDTENDYHKKFGAFAMAQVKTFYDEVEGEVVGPTAKPEKFSIYLDVGQKSKFVTVFKAKKKGELLVWECGSRTKIHFVWLGKYQGAHCTATPVAVAKQCPEHEVWLWVFKADAGGFRAEIKPEESKVQIMLLDSVEGPLGAQDWVKNAFGVINNLVRDKLWVAAKDLAVLLIMYEYGGLYFDTTVIVAADAECKKYASIAGVKARSLPDAVMALANAGPALPLALDAEPNRYQPNVYTVKSVTTGFDSKQAKTNPIRDMPPVEVWGYFSPAKHHKIFFGAATSYVIRAGLLGLDDTVPDIYEGKKELKGEYRDEVIGQLVIGSIYDGLTGVLGVDPEAIKKICWCATRFNDRPANLPLGGDVDVKADILPEFGIIKQYKGTWRKKT